MLSLGIMIYLVARKVPQIIDIVDENNTGGQKLFSKIDKFIASLPLEKIDFVVSQVLEKALRKLKLLLMKLDNQLTHHLKKFKANSSVNGENKKPALFEKLDDNGAIGENKTEAETENETEKNQRGGNSKN